MENLNQKAIEKLNSFRRLNYRNWNGYFCEPWYVGEKSEEYIRQVTSLLELLPVELTFIVPLQGGTTVQIEYEDDVWYIEFELNEGHSSNVYEQLYPSDKDIEYTCYWWEISNLLERGGKHGWGLSSASKAEEKLPE